MAKTSSTIEIKAPLKTVYNTVADFENYPEFISGTKAVKILKKTKTHLDIEFKVDVIKTITYSLSFKLDPPHGVTWTLIKGDFMKSNVGAWKLKEGKKGITEATYEIEVGFGLLVPGSIANALVAKNLPVMLKEFKERAES